jgi:hypothetical protein
VVFDVLKVVWSNQIKDLKLATKVNIASNVSCPGVLGFDIWMGVESGISLGGSTPS